MKLDGPAPRSRSLGVMRPLLLTLAAVGPAVRAPAGSGPAAGVEFYEKSIRPLLVEKCYDCHAATARRVRGGLRLDTPEGWLRGGDRGPAVKPGDPEGSLLLAAVRYDHEDESLRMPPKGKLTPVEIAALERWIGLGAPAPSASGDPPRAVATRATDPGADHWAFRPIADPEPPAVADESWPRDGLDRFILAGLERAGIAPAPPADRRTLIRRATFDLIGLPPTPEEVDAFLRDEAPGAFERVVERLLASPHYGERWGRHWLDVARYADSNGLDENVAHGNAWRYRDYVVAAFNADLPFDRFLTEQLAGDLLPASGSAGPLVATGFLALGPKVLAEVDEAKMEMDIIDEQVDVVGRAFMGLTLGCARCHDHKFDPIPTADYYGLAGIFQSTRTMETFTKVARWHENSLATDAERAAKEAHDRTVAAKKAELKALDDAKATGPGADADRKRLREEIGALEASAPELPSAMGVSEGKVVATRIHVRGSHLTLGAEVPRHVPAAVAGPSPPTFPPTASGRAELARWLASIDHPLTARVFVNRAWRWHFGRGLVATPDNFGLLGASPTDPALLDWLARRFAEGGWSIKSLHRRIMLSKTYQMSSRADPPATAADPENRLFGRAEVRRLEAEAIRDALLAASGRLDRALGGSLLKVKNRAYFFDHTSRDLTDYGGRRRSLYLPVVRNHLYEVFQLFDVPDPGVSNGDRSTTTVAPQSLFLLNGEPVLEAAEALADDVLGRADLDDAGRVAALYERCYGRPPSPEESSRALSALDRIGATLRGEPEPSRRPAAWQALAQALLASNEFLTLR